MGTGLEGLATLTVAYGMNFVGALAVAIIGWWAAGAVQRSVKRALAMNRVDETLANFLSSLARYTVLILVFLVILQLIGVQATSLIAVIGAASLAIGLALQGTLSNMAAGVMLLLFRPFKLTDDIEVAGKRGLVRDLSLFITELEGEGGVQVLIPNSQVWNAPIVNHTAYKRNTPATT
jgi:small conductance mechanosensitive channel